MKGNKKEYKCHENQKFRNYNHKRKDLTLLGEGKEDKKKGEENSEQKQNKTNLRDQQTSSIKVVFLG